MGSVSNDPNINKKHKKEANPFEDLLLGRLLISQVFTCDLSG
jgi:hypothetical protein